MLLSQQQNLLKRRLQEQALITEVVSQQQQEENKTQQVQNKRDDKAVEEDDEDNNIMERTERHEMDKELYVSETAIGGEFSLAASKRALDLFYILQKQYTQNVQLKCDPQVFSKIFSD